MSLTCVYNDSSLHFLQILSILNKNNADAKHAQIKLKLKLISTKNKDHFCAFTLKF